MTLHGKNLILTADLAKGEVTSLVLFGKERLWAPTALFRLSLRNAAGEAVVLSSREATAWEATADGARYRFAEGASEVRFAATEEGGEIALRCSAVPRDGYCVEWVEPCALILPETVASNPEGGRILFPYNEGVLVSDLAARDETGLRHEDAAYPSKGAYAVFPNMICSQMMAYLWEDGGLYMGAHDPRRGVKEIDFVREAGGVALRFRLFCGGEGEMDYPLVLSCVEGRWESAAERYRRWVEAHLPKGAKRVAENGALPAWYEDSPLVVSYPVRGVHDMDEMKPNRLFPYMAAMPLLDGIRRAVDHRLLVLLMHWEGTAPWAPPYVWPPYGGEECFDEFLRALHERGDLLGVYCSGFGYTVQSNLIAEYNKEGEYAEGELWRGMCAAPDGTVGVSNICTGQRRGYDICPASALGREILGEAYRPLLESEIDYVQILDQNHGGGQYFCYSRDHGHPPAPGAWMTEEMQGMLAEWNETAGATLFGCESAAAEPFIGNLAFSDNRFELGYHFGEPVPLYSYLYHEYLRNFMGNQVSCPLLLAEKSLLYRLAYSFAAGDAMTLVLGQDGEFLSRWGQRDFSDMPDRERVLAFVGRMVRFYKEEAKPYLFAGRMIPAPAFSCGRVEFPLYKRAWRVDLPSVICTAWRGADGTEVAILVNPGEKAEECRLGESTVTVPAREAVLVRLGAGK